MSRIALRFAYGLVASIGVGAISLGQGVSIDYMPPSHGAVVDSALPNATLLEGGIRFVEKSAGTGSQIQRGDKVTALHVCRLLDGTIFNQKRSRSHTFEFVVGASPRQTILGWERAMPLMQEGGTYTLAIPSEFAYRDKGREDQVPPYSTVFFAIEILEVER